MSYVLLTIDAGVQNQAPLDVSQDRSRRTGTFTRSTGSSIDFSPDGRTVAIPSINNTALWDVAGGVDPTLVGTIPRATKADGTSRRTATFSPDGRVVATSKVDYDGSHGLATLSDIGDLNELRADPSVQACTIAGQGLSEDDWTRYVPELPYRKICPN